MTRVQESFAGRLLKAYGDSKSAAFASGLAFNAFMTMFPLILGLLAIIGFLIQDPGTYAKVQSIVLGIFPSSAHQELEPALKFVHGHAGIMGVVSIGGLIWSGTGLFSAMEFALGEIFGTSQRDFLRQRLMGLVMMVGFLAAILFAVGANSAAAVIPFAPFGGLIVGSVVLVGLLAAIYRFVPNRTFTLRQVLPGAVLAGVGVEVLTFAFPIYAGLTHNFNSYGRQFALFFLLAAWLYFLSQLLLLGAVFNRMRLGAPEHEGLVATPGRDSKRPPRPSEAIEQQRAATEMASTAAQRQPKVEAAKPAQPAGPLSSSRRLLYSGLGVVIAAMATWRHRKRRPA